MIRPAWKPVRLLLLAGVFGSTLWVLSRAIAAPKAEKATQPVYAFSKTIPVEGWELQSSVPLSKTDDLPPGQQYQYRQQATSLEVEARLLFGDGNVSRLLFVHTPIRTANANLQVRHHSSLGYYGVVAYEGKAYLSACVNSRGGSTVTEPQFMQNRYKYDLRINRVLPWVLGQEPLIDQRCLWTLMSTSLPANARINSEDTKEAFKKLETAWLSWHEWWRKNFPPA